MRNPILAIVLLALPAAAQIPTAGFVQYASTFNVQRPYDLPVSARFSDTGGMYTTWVYPKDKPHVLNNTTAPRTEMRWETWTNQGIDHMWEADVMYESHCNKTCIMQVKNTVAGEAIYLRVVDGGDLIWLGTNSIILRGYYGKWFNLKSAFNPATGIARVWVDDKLIATNNRGKGGSWYFKNGTYTVEGIGPAVAHFKNIKLRVYSPGAVGLAAIAPNGALPGPRLGFDARGRLVRNPARAEDTPLPVLQRTAISVK